MLSSTDGRSATQRAAETGIANTVLIDLALDYSTGHPPRGRRRRATAGRAAAAPRSACCRPPASPCLRFADVPGLAVMRTVAMLANEAADAVNQGVCDRKGRRRRR